MRPPSVLQWLFGNPVCALVLVLGALFVGYRWLTGEFTWFAALLAAMVAGYSARAYERVASYSAWKREWDMMNGRSPGLRLPRIGGLRYVLGIVAWMFLALLAIGSAADPAMRIPVVLFWLATAVMVVVGLYRLIRGHSGRASTGKGMVRVCLGTPVQSANVQQALRALPAYCRIQNLAHAATWAAQP